MGLRRALEKLYAPLRPSNAETWVTSLLGTVSFDLLPGHRVWISEPSTRCLCRAAGGTRISGQGDMAATRLGRLATSPSSAHRPLGGRARRASAPPIPARPSAEHKHSQPGRSARRSCSTFLTYLRLWPQSSY